MKIKYIIIYVLNGAAQLWVLGCILSFVLQIWFVFSTREGYSFSRPDGSIFSIGNMYYGGYPVPAQISVGMPPDTIVSYKNGLATGEMRLSNSTRFRYEKADSILNNTSIKKQFYFSTWLTEPALHEWKDNNGDYWAANEFALFDSTRVYYSKKNIAATIEDSYSFTTSIKLKSKLGYKNFAFALYSLINVFAMLIISFNTAILLNSIRKRENFLAPMYKKIFLIGLILVLLELIKLCLCILFSKWYGLVRLEKVSSITGLGGQEFNIQFNPTLDSSLFTILFGLTLIVIASLFKYGNKLEKENALTI